MQTMFLDWRLEQIFHNPVRCRQSLNSRENRIEGPLFQTASMSLNVYVLYDKLALQGVTHGRNSYMIKEEF